MQQEIPAIIASIKKGSESTTFMASSATSESSGLSSLRPIKHILQVVTFIRLKLKVAKFRLRVINSV